MPVVKVSTKIFNLPPILKINGKIIKVNQK